MVKIAADVSGCLSAGVGRGLRPTTGRYASPNRKAGRLCRGVGVVTVRAKVGIGSKEQPPKLFSST